ncbi:MAG TPA: hypothetical protein VM223_06800, partial [Planctomycetota bacterium]|nr:hypothetical protein [Planctomycetota bacterium]
STHWWTPKDGEPKQQVVRSFSRQKLIDAVSDVVEKDVNPDKINAALKRLADSLGTFDPNASNRLFDTSQEYFAALELIHQLYVTGD